MDQIVVGVFDQQNDVDRARRALADAGFAESALNVHSTSGASTTQTAGERSESGIAHFFRSLFGMDDHRDSARVYDEAVRRGHYVLTVQARDAAQAERAQDILEECDAIDVDERSLEWGSGARSAAAPATAGTATARNKPGESADAVGKKIPVVEEELRVGKREVQRGGVRVFARMTEQPAEETVRLREERVKVERRPVDRPATEEDFAAFKEGSIEVRETVEEPVVDKRARVVEEVYVGKETAQREETVRDSVRHTDVKVDRIEDDDRAQRRAAMSEADRSDFTDDDSDFRNHWQSNYANAGGSYEDYAPAYGYGSHLGSSGRYAGRTWEEIEPEARRDWDERYPSNTWERFKDSVRYGWERLTGQATPHRRPDEPAPRHVTR